MYIYTYMNIWNVVSLHLPISWPRQVSVCVIYIYLYTCIHIYIYTNMHTYVEFGDLVLTHLLASEGVCVYIYVYICKYIHTHTYTHIYTYSCIWNSVTWLLLIFWPQEMCVYMYIYISTHTHFYIYIYTYIYIYINLYIYVYICIHI